MRELLQHYWPYIALILFMIPEVVMVGCALYFYLRKRKRNQK